LKRDKNGCPFLNTNLGFLQYTNLLLFSAIQYDEQFINNFKANKLPNWRQNYQNGLKAHEHELTHGFDTDVIST